MSCRTRPALQPYTRHRLYHGTTTYTLASLLRLVASRLYRLAAISLCCYVLLPPSQQPVADIISPPVSQYSWLAGSQTSSQAGARKMVHVGRKPESAKSQRCLWQSPVHLRFRPAGSRKSPGRTQELGREQPGRCKELGHEGNLRNFATRENPGFRYPGRTRVKPEVFELE